VRKAYKTRRKYSAEEKIRTVLEGLRGEDSIAESCRREGINPNVLHVEQGVPGSRQGAPDRGYQAAGDRSEVVELHQENE